MSDVNDLLEHIKKVAVKAVEAGKPAAIVIGKVTNVSPLKINVEQKLTLTSAQLILTKNVTNYSINVAIDTATSESEAHSHKIEGTKKITIKNGLVVGEKVVLLREQGGQRFIVLDRIKT